MYRRLTTATKKVLGKRGQLSTRNTYFPKHIAQGMRNSKLKASAIQGVTLDHQTISLLRF